MRIFLLLAAVLLLCSCASPKKPLAHIHRAASIPDNPRFALKLPLSPVTYNGEVSYDNVGTSVGPMNYQAPNASAAVAALVTHAVIADSMLSSEKKRLQTAANSVVSSYREALSGFSHAELAKNGLVKLGSAAGNVTLLEQEESSAADLVLESTPIYILTQDRSTLMLQNTIAVYPFGQPKRIVYQNVVEVVSNAVSDADLTAYWSRDEGEAMKKLSTDLFADSLGIVLDEVGRADNSEAQTQDYKTFHYQQGSTDKVERGQLVAQTCNRMTIRTLRGWLRSVPVTAEAGAGSCTGQ